MPPRSTIYDLRAQHFYVGDAVQVLDLELRTLETDNDIRYYDPRSRLPQLPYTPGMKRLARTTFYVHNVIRCKYGYLYQISSTKGDPSTLTPHLWSRAFLQHVPQTNQDAARLLSDSTD